MFVQWGSACHAPGCLAQVRWAQARLSSGILGLRNECVLRGEKVPLLNLASSHLEKQKSQAGVHTSTLFDNLTWVIN